MRKNETTEHKQLKELISKKLEKWFGVAITEYQSAGHELDVFAVNINGVTLMGEIIWTASTTNFYRDMVLLLNSDAKIKIIIANPEIGKKEKLQREYTKIRINEMKKGTKVSEMLDGRRMLADDEYLNGIRLLIVSMIDGTTDNPYRENALSNMKDDESYESKDLDILKLDSIKNMIHEYKQLGIDMKTKYFAKFSLYSISNNLYKQEFFTKFVIKEFKNITDPHILLHCINIITNFIGVSKRNCDIFFIDILWNKIHKYIEKYFLSNDDLHTYSFIEIQTTISEFGDRWTKEQLCKMYWSKLESQINLNSTTDNEKNRVYACIKYYRKNCKLNKSQRKWMLKEGENKELRENLLNELL